MTVRFDVESVQIVAGCVVIHGVAEVRSDWLRADVSLDGRRLPAIVEWPSPAPRGLARRLGAMVLPDRRTARHLPFTVRAIAGSAVTAADAKRLALTIRSGRDHGTVSDLLQPWIARDLVPAIDRLYGRFMREVESRPGARLLELGSRARSGIERRSHFPGAAYTGFDIKEGPSVDVVGDAHQLSRYFPPDSFDYATSVSVFEHLAAPWKVALELGRTLTLGSLVYTQSHQTWPLHDEPWDFFRFSKNAWGSLFCRETGFEIVDRAEIMPARIVPMQQTGDPSIAIEGGTGYLLSACLARKIGPATVTWDAVPDLNEVDAYPA